MPSGQKALEQKTLAEPCTSYSVYIVSALIFSALIGVDGRHENQLPSSTSGYGISYCC